MALVTLGLLFAFFSSLNKITKHGQSATVPEVTGETLTEALPKLQGFALSIDSVYQPYSKKLEIIYQEPAGGSIVKTGRTLFITVNKLSPPTITMPDLVNMSFRNAVLTLQSYRLVMGDTIFRPDLAAGAVLAQMQNGKLIARGAQVPIGSRVDLVIGAGLGDTTMPVPNLIGLNYAQVKSMMDAMGVTMTIVWDGTITDSNSAIIYKQFPESKDELEFAKSIAPGDLMDLYIMQKPSAELLRLNQPGVIRYLDPRDSNATISFAPPTSLLPGDVDSNAPKVSDADPNALKKINRPRRSINDSSGNANGGNVGTNDEDPPIQIGTKNDMTDVQAPAEPVNKRPDEKERVIKKDDPKKEEGKKVEIKKEAAIDPKKDAKKEPAKEPAKDPKKDPKKVDPKGSVPANKQPAKSAKQDPPKKPKETIKKNSDTENEFK